MSEFKRGDRVEALNHGRCYPGILVEVDAKNDLVFFSSDANPTQIHRAILSIDIRHPVKKVKRMMQDWTHPDGDCRSWPVDFSVNLDGLGWRKSGPPTEREFEIPQ